MMGVSQSKSADSALFDCLASERRRAVVAALRGAPDDLSERELAARTVSRLDGTEPGQVSDDACQRVRIGLHHRDLPKLEAVGLVERDEAESRVGLDTHPALSDPGIRSVLESPSADESVAALFEALADERRQRVLSLISGLRRPIELREIAAHVAAHERACSQSAVPDEVVERVYAELWHAHLPKFRDADVVEYDQEAETLAFDGHPDLRPKWLDSGFGGRFADA